eukprot:SAG11_NODE_1249_length_5393_cov_4.349641_3_plen_116_part_00
MRAIRAPQVDPIEELEATAQWLFEQTDEDGNGQLDKDELRKLLQESGMESVDEKRLAQIFRKLDKSENGFIEYEDFREWWVNVRDDDALQIQTSGRCVVCRRDYCHYWDRVASPY